jgi:hypothetical protein
VGKGECLRVEKNVLVLCSIIFFIDDTSVGKFIKYNMLYMWHLSTMNKTKIFFLNILFYIVYYASL